MQQHPEKTEEYLNFFVDLQIKMSKERVPLLGHLRDKMHAKISASGFPATVRYDLHVLSAMLPVLQEDFGNSDSLHGYGGRQNTLPMRAIKSRAF